MRSMRNVFAGLTVVGLVAASAAALLAGSAHQSSIAPSAPGRTTNGVATTLAAITVATAAATATTVASAPAPTPVQIAPSLKPGFERYESVSGWTFDYPSSWKLMADRLEYQHYSNIGPVVGTGDWQIPLCFTPAPGETLLWEAACGTPSWNLAPGSVVVEFRMNGGPLFVPDAPYGWTPLRQGIVVLHGETNTGDHWQVYFPEHVDGQGRLEREGLIETIEVRYGPGDSTASRAQVRALIDSLWYPGTLATPNP